MKRMTQHIVQARLSASDVEQLDRDSETLGLQSRSDAVRAGLRLLHRQARYSRLGQDYDDFYGSGGEVPLSDLAMIGGEIAAESAMAAADSGDVPR